MTMMFVQQRGGSSLILPVSVLCRCTLLLILVIVVSHIGWVSPRLFSVASSSSSHTSRELHTSGPLHTRNFVVPKRPEKALVSARRQHSNNRSRCSVLENHSGCSYHGVPILSRAIQLACRSRGTFNPKRHAPVVCFCMGGFTGVDCSRRWKGRVFDETIFRDQHVELDTQHLEYDGTPLFLNSSAVSRCVRESKSYFRERMRSEEFRTDRALDFFLHLARDFIVSSERLMMMVMRTTQNVESLLGRMPSSGDSTSPDIDKSFINGGTVQFLRTNPSTSSISTAVQKYVIVDVGATTGTQLPFWLSLALHLGPQDGTEEVSREPHASLFSEQHRMSQWQEEASRYILLVEPNPYNVLMLRRRLAWFQALFWISGETNQTTSGEDVRTAKRLLKFNVAALPLLPPFSRRRGEQKKTGRAAGIAPSSLGQLIEIILDDKMAFMDVFADPLALFVGAGRTMHQGSAIGEFRDTMGQDDGDDERFFPRTVGTRRAEEHQVGPTEVVVVNSTEEFSDFVDRLLCPVLRTTTDDDGSSHPRRPQPVSNPVLSPIQLRCYREQGYEVWPVCFPSRKPKCVQIIVAKYAVHDHDRATMPFDLGGTHPSSENKVSRRRKSLGAERAVLRRDQVERDNMSHHTEGSALLQLSTKRLTTMLMRDLPWIDDALSAMGRYGRWTGPHSLPPLLDDDAHSVREVGVEREKMAATQRCYRHTLSFLSHLRIPIIKSDAEGWDPMVLRSLLLPSSSFADRATTWWTTNTTTSNEQQQHLNRLLLTKAPLIVFECHTLLIHLHANRTLRETVELLSGANYHVFRIGLYFWIPLSTPHFWSMPSGDETESDANLYEDGNSWGNCAAVHASQKLLLRSLQLFPACQESLV